MLVTSLVRRYAVSHTRNLDITDCPLSVCDCPDTVRLLVTWPQVWRVWFSHQVEVYYLMLSFNGILTDKNNVYQNISKVNFVTSDFQRHVGKQPFHQHPPYIPRGKSALLPCQQCTMVVGKINTVSSDCKTPNKNTTLSWIMCGKH